MILFGFCFDGAQPLLYGFLGLHPPTKYAMVMHFDRKSILFCTLVPSTCTTMAFLFKRNPVQLQDMSFESFSPDINLVGWISAYLPRLVPATMSSNSTWSSHCTRFACRPSSRRQVRGPPVPWLHWHTSPYSVICVAASLASTYRLLSWLHASAWCRCVASITCFPTSPCSLTTLVFVTKPYLAQPTTQRPQLSSTINRAC